MGRRLLTGPNIGTGICNTSPYEWFEKLDSHRFALKNFVMSSCSGNSSCGTLYPSEPLRICLIAGSTTATWRPARRRYRSRTASSASGSPSTTCSRPELLPTPFVLKWIDMHGFSTYRALFPCEETESFLTTCAAPNRFLTICAAPDGFLITCAVLDRFLTTCAAPNRFLTTCEAPNRFLTKCASTARILTICAETERSWKLVQQQ